MVKKIKEYFKLKKLYRDSKKVIIINAAETIAELSKVLKEMASGKE